MWRFGHVGKSSFGTKERSNRKDRSMPNEKLFKKYRGSASRDSKGNDKNVEGNHKIVPYKGKVHRLLSDIKDGIHFQLCWKENNLSEYHSKVEFVRVTKEP